MQTHSQAIDLNSIWKDLMLNQTIWKDPIEAIGRFEMELDYVHENIFKFDLFQSIVPVSKKVQLPLHFDSKTIMGLVVSGQFE